MGKSANIEVPPEQVAEMEAEIRHYFHEIEQALKRMKKRQGRIDKLKASTRAILAKLKAA